MTRPPTKPPPGALWPRSRKNTEITPATGSSRRPSTAGTRMYPRGNESSGSLRVPICASMRCARGNGHAFRRGAEAAQQLVDGQRDDGDHGDLAQRVEAAEVHQDHVDHVAATAVRQRMLHEEPRDAVAARARHDDIGEAGETRARNHAPAPRRAPGAGARGVCGDRDHRFPHASAASAGPAGSAPRSRLRR